MKAILYTVVFAFDKNLSNLILIRKRKPIFQYGFLNGIGGKVEDDETELQCAVREFKEETGIELLQKNLIQFAKLSTNSYGINARIFFYVTCLRKKVKIKQMTSEKVGWVSYANLNLFPLFSNLKWLIPMAKLKLEDKFWKENGVLIY